jgi:hypothetical protein
MDMLDDFTMSDYVYAPDPVDGHQLQRTVYIRDMSVWSPARRNLVGDVCELLWGPEKWYSKVKPRVPSPELSLEEKAADRENTRRRRESCQFWLSADCKRVESSHAPLQTGLGLEDPLCLGDFELYVEVQPLPCPWPLIPESRPRFLVEHANLIGRPAASVLQKIGFTPAQLALLPPLFDQHIRDIAAAYWPSGNDENIEVDSDTHRFTVLFETS